MNFKDFFKELKKIDNENTSYVEEDKMFNDYLILCIEEKMFAFNIENIEEVIEPGPILISPEKSSCIKGVMPYEKTMINIIDLRLKLKFKAKSFNKDMVIIVFKFNDKLIGVAVDDVIDVIELNIGNLKNVNIKINNGKNEVTILDEFNIIEIKQIMRGVFYEN